MVLADPERLALALDDRNVTILDDSMQRAYYRTMKQPVRLSTVTKLAAALSTTPERLLPVPNPLERL
jgi:hypothetical protein